MIAIIKKHLTCYPSQIQILFSIIFSYQYTFLLIIIIMIIYYDYHLIIYLFGQSETFLFIVLFLFISQMIIFARNILTFASQCSYL